LSQPIFVQQKRRWEFLVSNAFCFRIFFKLDKYYSSLGTFLWTPGSLAEKNAKENQGRI